MDGSHPDTESHGPPPITLPMRSLLVLSGPAGAGKSTFARKLVQAHEQQGFKHTLLDLARRHSYYTCLLTFNVPTEISLRRDQRRERSVGERVVAYHGELLLKTLQDVPNEGWDQMHILDERAIDAVAIEIAISKIE